MYERTYNSRVLKTEESPKKKKGKQVPWKRIGIVGGVLVFVVGIAFLIHTPRFQVRTVDVVGASVVDPSEVSEYTLNLLEGTYLWIFPKTSIFLISSEDIAKAVQERFPRFKHVRVDRTGMHGLRITAEEYPGVYLWCDTTCAFMDETGTVFADAPYFSGSAYIKIYKGIREQYPFHPVTQDDLAQVQSIQAKLTAIDIVPLSITFTSPHTLTVVFTHGAHQAELYFDPSENIEDALETLYSGLRSDAVASQYHSSAKVLKYLDVRFANKLIYKFE